MVIHELMGSSAFSPDNLWCVPVQVLGPGSGKFRQVSVQLADQGFGTFGMIKVQVPGAKSRKVPEGCGAKRSAKLDRPCCLGCHRSLLYFSSW